jgi:senataxin
MFQVLIIVFLPEKIIINMQMCNLSTIAREYVAIKTISTLLFKDLILNAGGEDFGTEAAGWKIPLPLDKHVKENFNQYQHEAITVSFFYFRS